MEAPSEFVEFRQKWRRALAITGRINRLDFLVCLVLFFVGIVASVILDVIIGRSTAAFWILGTVCWWFWNAGVAKRFHDFGISAWISVAIGSGPFVAIILGQFTPTTVPLSQFAADGLLFGWVALTIISLSIPGKRGANQFGPIPKPWPTISYEWAEECPASEPNSGGIRYRSPAPVFASRNSYHAPPEKGPPKDSGGIPEHPEIHSQPIMTIQTNVVCPHCQQHLDCTGVMAGIIETCPTCEGQFEVPDSQPCNIFITPTVTSVVKNNFIKQNEMRLKDKILIAAVALLILTWLFPPMSQSDRYQRTNYETQEFDGFHFIFSNDPYSRRRVLKIDLTRLAVLNLVILGLGGVSYFVVSKNKEQQA
ncbi:MAG: hypothetical protein RLZZ398_1418 [Verrucomicrobiota bacterium]|jgi:uncharacterized membrane protein YhaH (DUF805 family)